MDTTSPSAVLLNHAVSALMSRGNISSQAAAAALIEAAEQLHEDVGDLAALVVASEQQRQFHLRSSRSAGASRSPMPELLLVGEEPAASIGDNSWTLRDPGYCGSLSRSRHPLPGLARWALPKTAGAGPGTVVGLSERESDIIALVTEGLSNQEIADQMYLSINSVKTHIRSAYRKMGVKRRPQAVLWGIDHGFGSPPLEQTGA